jgi:acetyl-CoA carboxylase biotin carboxyl carrier protein
MNRSSKPVLTCPKSREAFIKMGEKKTYTVVTPVMGVFYRSPGPDEKPFVEAGTKIKAKDVVCLIESMKIFTEIRSEKPGTVKTILVDNEDMVMKNQKLIEIETD